ncbi:radical SAM protein [Thermodesulfobacteriota bacterium]
MNRNILTMINILKVKYSGARVPMLISWIVTKRCNFRCSFCGIWKEESGELGTREAVALIREMASMGAAAISFIGGEPLLREDLSELLDACREKGIKTRVTSNGSLVSSFPERLSHVDILKLSLDGPEEVHDALRERGSFRNVVDTAVWAKGKGIKTIFNCIITNRLEDNLAELLKIAGDLKVPITFQPLEFRSSDTHENVASLMPAPGEMNSVLKKIIEAKRTHPRLIGNSSTSLEFMESWPALRPMRCYAGSLFCKILPDGEVVACDSLDRPKEGGAHPGSFGSAFESLSPIGSCEGCWRNNTIDINLSLSFNISAIVDIATNYLLKR